MENQPARRPQSMTLSRYGSAVVEVGGELLDSWIEDGGVVGGDPEGCLACVWGVQDKRGVAGDSASVPVQALEVRKSEDPETGCAGGASPFVTG